TRIFRCGKSFVNCCDRCAHAKSGDMRAFTSLWMAKLRAAYALDATAKAMASKMVHHGRLTQRSTRRMMEDCNMCSLTCADNYSTGHRVSARRGQPALE